MKAYIKNIKSDNFSQVKDGLYLHELTCDYVIGEELKENVQRIFSPNEYKMMLTQGFIIVNSANDLNNEKWKSQISDIIQSSYVKTMDKINIPIPAVDYLSYYGDESVRETCHDVKGTDTAKRKRAVLIIAEHLSRFPGVGPGTVLIPAPQRTGRAIYTAEIAKEIALRTGARVMDILRCKPHRSLYILRSENKPDSIEMYLDSNEEIPDVPTFFVDNVMSKGTTFNAANKVLNNRLIPLVYAVDYTKDNPISKEREERKYG